MGNNLKTEDTSWKRENDLLRRVILGVSIFCHFIPSMGSVTEQNVLHNRILDSLLGCWYSTCVCSEHVNDDSWLFLQHTDFDYVLFYGHYLVFTGNFFPPRRQQMLDWPSNCSFLYFLWALVQLVGSELF